MACSYRPPEVWPKTGLKTQIALFPPENLSGRSVPMKRIGLELRQALQRAGLQLIDASRVEAFLAERRLRYTAGLSRAAAQAARYELGADAVLISALDGYDRDGPKQSMVMRLVSTGELPRILWIDGAARAGDDAPGLFDLGVVRSDQALRASVIGELVRSLATFLAGRGPRATACASASRLDPKATFVAPGFNRRARRRGRSAVPRSHRARKCRRRAADSVRASIAGNEPLRSPRSRRDT